jgi:hypothetical protein
MDSLSATGSLDSDRIARKIVDALLELCDRDRYLLEVDVNERSLTHRLAIYLEKSFPGYDVDCEYNRDVEDPKRLHITRRKIDSADTDATTVYPDIIVHRRGKRGYGDNLVVIEAKKCGRDSKDDEEKLRAFLRCLGYRYAFFVEFPIVSGSGQPDPSSCVRLVQELQAYS